MIPYAQQHIAPAEVALFYRIRRAVKQIPDDLDLGVDEDGESVVLSCHMLARAVGKVFGLKVVDGKHDIYEHSWLLTPDGHVIDVYPVGTLGGPIMLLNAYSLDPGRRFYYTQKTTEWVSGGRFSQPSFERAVALVTQLLHEALARQDLHGSVNPAT